MSKNSLVKLTAIDADIEAAVECAIDAFADFIEKMKSYTASSDVTEILVAQTEVVTEILNHAVDITSHPGSGSRVRLGRAAKPQFRDTLCDALKWNNELDAEQEAYGNIMARAKALKQGVGGLDTAIKVLRQAELAPVTARTEMIDYARTLARAKALKQGVGDLETAIEVLRQAELASSDADLDTHRMEWLLGPDHAFIKALKGLLSTDAKHNRLPRKGDTLAAKLHDFIKTFPETVDEWIHTNTVDEWMPFDKYTARHGLSGKGKPRGDVVPGALTPPAA